eukprot:9919296-Heterocapsa_arctica.AAC.1
MPEQLGHDVNICGKYEYCLGWGRNTKAKHIDTAKHVFWRREICTPILRLRQNQDKQHKVGFIEWWCCTACEAKGPTMNNKFCSSYTHKRWENTDSDHSGHDSDDRFPGHKVRISAYNRMVENHKDKVSQQKEET